MTTAPLFMMAILAILIVFVNTMDRANAANPGSVAGAPIQPIPKGTNVSKSAPPVTELGPVHTIQLPGGVTITITSTNKFNRAQLQRWLLEARTIR